MNTRFASALTAVGMSAALLLAGTGIALAGATGAAEKCTGRGYSLKTGQLDQTLYVCVRMVLLPKEPNLPDRYTFSWYGVSRTSKTVYLAGAFDKGDYGRLADKGSRSAPVQRAWITACDSRPGGGCDSGTEVFRTG